ncbi:MAG: cytochrome C oxidase subunit IV family protein [Acidimicrobiia bacterium]
MTDVETVEPAAVEAVEPAAGHELPMLPGELRPHPQPSAYVIVAAILAVVTSFEVAISYTDMPDGLMIALLLTMAAIKFGMIASWFMHLRTDAPIFRRFFVLGVVAAIVLFSIATISLHIFTPK